MTDTSSGLGIGAPAPVSGEMLGVDGRTYTLDAFEEAELLVVVFVGNGCPTVRAYEDRLNRLHEDFANRGVQILAVNANNPYLSPFDTHEQMVSRAIEAGLPFPYLKDAQGGLARAFGAVSTPHAFVFDPERRLRYRGRIDDARIPETVKERDLEEALRALLEGRTPPAEVTEPFGCSIIW